MLPLSQQIITLAIGNAEWLSKNGWGELEEIEVLMVELERAGVYA